MSLACDCDVEGLQNAMPPLRDGDGELEYTDEGETSDGPRARRRYRLFSSIAEPPVPSRVRKALRSRLRVAEIEGTGPDWFRFGVGLDVTFIAKGDVIVDTVAPTLTGWMGSVATGELV